MARPKKDETPDLGVTHELSEGVIARLACPPGAPKAFLRDKDVTGLKVRVTANGAKAFVYEAKLNGRAISRTLGRFPLMSIEDAKAKARALATTIKTDKKDPRELERLQAEAEAAAAAEKTAQEAAAATQQAAQALTLGTVWADYLQARRAKWSASHHADHLRYSQAGGERKKRGKGDTAPGPLFPLLAERLQDLTPERLRRWAEKEAAARPTVTRNAARLLRACLAWCTEHPQFSAIAPTVNPAGARTVREALGRPGVKRDALQREQLPAWFDAVRGLSNPVVAAYLQAVLLTGARPGEVLAMQWDDLNAKWKGLTVRDKVEGERVIPLTPYLWHLLGALPRRGPFVFASRIVKDAHLTEPNHAHDRACKVAGIEPVTLHGLRRSFKSLTEWLEIPAGVVAQLMGHKPSATAEKHYTVRPLDLLRVHHERIEAWILEQAGVQFDAKAAPGALRVVSTHSKKSIM